MSSDGGILHPSPTVGGGDRSDRVACVRYDGCFVSDKSEEDPSCGVLVRRVWARILDNLVVEHGLVASVTCAVMGTR